MGGNTKLLRLCHTMSQTALGREAGGRRWGPRPLDLDIIFYGNERIATETLEVHRIFIGNAINVLLQFLPLCW